MQQRLIRLPLQVGVGDAGDQADLRAALGLFGGQVLLQGLLTEAADTTEEVQLPGVDAQGRAVLTAGAGFTGLAQIGRQALASAGALPWAASSQSTSMYL